MKTIQYITCCLVFFCTIMFAVSLSSQAKPALKTDLGDIALVIRGGEKVTYNFHRVKKLIWKGAVGGAVGGVVGAVVASDSGDDAKAIRKDLEKEKEISSVLAGWNYIAPFNDNFQKNLAAPYSNIKKVILNPENSQKFRVVDREFYHHGSSRYGRDEIVYDYTPLAKEGIPTVLEVTLDAQLTAKSGYSGKPKALFAATERLLDIRSKTALSDKRSLKWGDSKMIQEYEKWVADKGALIRTSFEKLAGSSGSKLAGQLR